MLSYELDFTPNKSHHINLSKQIYTSNMKSFYEVAQKCPPCTSSNSIHIVDMCIVKCFGEALLT